MNKFRKIMITIVAMALLVMGGTAVFAQQEDNGSTISVQQTEDGQQQDDFAPPEDGNLQGNRPQGRPDGKGNNRFLDREATSEVIANALGITTEELEAAHEAGTKLPELAESLGVEMEVVEAAIEAARAEAIAQAVADGTITQEEADEIAERAFLKNVIRDIFDRDAMTAVAADVLGLTVEELEAAKEEGVRFPELAEEAGIEMSVLTDAMEQAKADALQDAVDSGLITQEQADEIASHEGNRRHGKNGNCGSGGGPNGGQQPQGDFNAAPVDTDV